MLPESGTQEVLSLGISIQGMCPQVGGDTVEPLSPWIMESQLPQGWVIAGAESSSRGRLDFHRGLGEKRKGKTWDGGQCSPLGGVQRDRGERRTLRVMGEQKGRWRAGQGEQERKEEERPRWSVREREKDRRRNGRDAEKVRGEREREGETKRKMHEKREMEEREGRRGERERKEAKAKRLLWERRLGR